MLKSGPAHDRAQTTYRRSGSPTTQDSTPRDLQEGEVVLRHGVDDPGISARKGRSDLDARLIDIGVRESDGDCFACGIVDRIHHMLGRDDVS